MSVEKGVRLEKGVSLEKGDGVGGPGPPAVSAGAVLGLLIFDGVLLGAFGLVFTPLHAAGVPVPLGAILSIMVLPWLVHRAGEVDPRPAVASAPLAAWLLTVVVLGLTGPGGDVMLPITWQSLLLVVGGVVVGLVALRSVLEGGGRRDG